MNLAYQAYRLLWEGLDLLYPPTCGGCGTPGSRWCANCSRSAAEITPPICPICGNPNHSNQPCDRCQAEPPSFKALRSSAVYEDKLREAIHRLKYKNDIGMGEALARPMIASLQKLNWSLDIVTSVPLGLARLKQRGYNQAILLARPLAMATKIPFQPKALVRVRETNTQVGLNVRERRENMTDAFRAKKSLVHGKNVLVVDDVATSGATIDACAKALLDGGAASVYGFSLARAVYTLGAEIDIT